MVDYQRLRLWFKALFRPGRVEEELREEMLLHLEMEIGKNIRSGMGEDEARRILRSCLIMQDENARKLSRN